jgi:hypothetical protein
MDGGSLRQAVDGWGGIAVQVRIGKAVPDLSVSDSQDMRRIARIVRGKRGLSLNNSEDLDIQGKAQNVGCSAYLTTETRSKMGSQFSHLDLLKNTPSN